MINALVMLAAAGFGFGGSPWIGFAICAPVAIVVSFPRHLDVLARYYGEPKTDIALMMPDVFLCGQPRDVRKCMSWLFACALVEALVAVQFAAALIEAPRMPFLHTTPHLRISSGSSFGSDGWTPLPPTCPNLAAQLCQLLGGLFLTAP
jgi:hypothetical protein